jgi:cytochrome c oxidase subunit III
MNEAKSEVYLDWEIKRREAARTGLYLLLASIVMFFGALTSVLIIRSGTSDDFHGVPIPRVLWFSTAAILASSYFLVKNQRRIGMLCGLLFLAGQSVAWFQLVGLRGPGSWFFWTFSVAHAGHMLGGFLGFKWARFELARLYWHFVTGLWIYVVVLFLIWRN